MSQDVATIIRGVWCEVLELESIGEGDDFFDIGGHSLSAMRVTSRLREALGGIRVPTQVLFRHRALEAFTEAVEERLRQVASA